MSDIAINSERIAMTPLSESEAAAVFAYRSLPEVSRFQTFEPGSVHDVEVLIRNAQPANFDRQDAWVQLGIRLRSTGELIGDIGIHFLDEDAKQIEIGFTMAPLFQGKGLATEAVTAVLDYLFVQAGKHRVTASVDSRNTRSIGLLVRIGMRKEAHFRERLWLKGEWADDLIFAMLQSDWRVQKRKA